MSAARDGYAVRRGSDTLWRDRRPLLTTLDVELTERCDNRCIHCCVNRPQDDRDAEVREMATARVLAILDEAADLGALVLRLTGGEILLRPDFEEIYLHARRLGLRVSLLTNARGVTARLAKVLADIPPLGTVEVTAYGMHEESYEAVSRVRGAYAEYRRGLELLIDHGVPFTVRGTLLPPTRHEMGLFEGWAATLPGMEERPGYVYFLELRHRRDDPAASRRIAALRLTPEEALASLERDPRLARSLSSLCAAQAREPSDRVFKCGIGLRPCVDAYGVLQPCLSLRDPELAYDLEAGSMREALTDVFPRLREVRATDPEYLRRCARCFLAGMCDQCPAKSYAEHGTWDTPVDYTCEMTQAEARFIGLLADDERPWDVVDWRERIACLKS